ncbi:MAG: O-antigen ligase family protein [Verrucomicrobiota bacterium]|nr:O-antigen ligase family protein [Verrucomicrobiota bacterium]
MLAAVLVAVALAGLQVLIGGTRLVYSLPIYGLLGVAGLLAVFSVRRTSPTAGRLCLWSTALFFGYVLARAWFSPVPYLARTDIFSVLAGLVVYLAVAGIFTSAPWRMAILLFLLLIALVQVGIGAVQFRNGDNFMLIPFLQRFDYGRRASGFYACPNHFAGLVEVLGIFCLSLACWSRWPVWSKLLLGYAGGLCYVGLALTGSRGGYLSAGFSMVAIAVLTLVALRKAGRTVFWRVAGVGAVFAVLLLGALVFGFRKSDYLTDRAHNVVDTQNIRLDLWQAAIAQWKLAPLVGTGSGTYLYYGRRFRTERVQLDPVEVHNDYLHLLAEYGLLGGVAFLVFLGTHLWQGLNGYLKLGPWRMAASGRPLSNNLALNIGALGAVAAYLVHSVFDFNLHIPANVGLLAFVFGALANPVSGKGNDTPHQPRWQVERHLVLPLLGLLLLVGAIRYARAEYFAERARVALREERHLQATRWAQRAVQLDSQNPETFFYLGESRVRRAEALANPVASKSYYLAALEPFEQARALAPNDETFLIALGRVYDGLGRFPEAEWMFDQALAWDPRSLVTQKSYAAHLARWSRAGRGTEGSPRLDLPDKNAPLSDP